MKNVLIALLLVLIPGVAFADAPTPGPDDCYQKVITVCPNKKPKHKHKPVLICPTCPEATVITVPGPPVIKEVVKTVVVTKVVTKYCGPVPCPPEDPIAVLGVYGELGLGVRPPYTTGELGMQLEFPKPYLGLRVFTDFQYGVGFQGLIYAYRGPIVKVHVLDPGVLVTGGLYDYISVPNVHRSVDLILGLGVQVKITCHLSFIADYRVDIPDPQVLASRDGKPCGPCTDGVQKRLNASNVVGNAFAESQIKVGLLAHF